MMAIDDYQSTFDTSPSNRYSLPSCIGLAVSRASILKEGDDCTGFTAPTTTFIVPEVQKGSTVRYTHQLGRLAAASTPSDESTSVLWERRQVHQVK
jgi:hypothetical protein